MSPNSDSGPTELLRAWSHGDGSALGRLMPLVYDELHRLARRYMRQERPDHTLQATSLVNEAYLRLIDVNRVEWRDRAHFLAVAAQMMRRILVESARNRRRQKRGGGAVHLNLDEVRRAARLEGARRRCAQRCAQRAGDVRCSYEPSCRVEILWWPDRRRNSGRLEHLTGDCHAGLEDREGLAPP